MIKGCGVPSLIEIGIVILEEIFISLYCYYLPLKKDATFHLYKLESSCYCAKFIEIESGVWRLKCEKVYRQTTSDQKSSIKLR